MIQQRGPGYYGQGISGLCADRKRNANGKLDAILRRQMTSSHFKRPPASRSLAVPTAVLIVGAMLLSLLLALVITGTPVGSEARANQTTMGNQQDPAIAVGSGGEFIVVWESEEQDGDGYGIFARLYDSTGAPKGSEFQVNTNTTGDQCNPAVSYDGGTGYIIAWQSYGDYWDGESNTTFGIFKRSFSNLGVPATPEDMLVNVDTVGNQTSPCVIAASATRYVIIWVDDETDGDGEGILGRRYSPGAQPPQVFQVNTCTTGDQSEPDSSIASDSSFVVVWSSDGQDGDSGGIYGQAFSSGAAPQGSEFEVNTWTSGNQSAPSIAANETDCYIVVWASYGQDGDGSGIFCQMLDEDLSPVGSEFQVNTYTAGDQAQPAVAVCPNQTFVVVWSSISQDGSGAGIYGQEVKTNGDLLGSEFRVNTYTSDDQQSPDVCDSATGGYVVGWDSYLQDGDGTGIYYQRFIYTEIPEFSHLAIVVSMSAILIMIARRKALQNRH